MRIYREITGCSYGQLADQIVERSPDEAEDYFFSMALSRNLQHWLRTDARQRPIPDDAFPYVCQFISSPEFCKLVPSAAMVFRNQETTIQAGLHTAQLWGFTSHNPTGAGIINALKGYWIHKHSWEDHKEWAEMRGLRTLDLIDEGYAGPLTEVRWGETGRLPEDAFHIVFLRIEPCPPYSFGVAHIRNYFGTYSGYVFYNDKDADLVCLVWHRLSRQMLYIGELRWPPNTGQVGAGIWPRFIQASPNYLRIVRPDHLVKNGLRRAEVSDIPTSFHEFLDVILWSVVPHGPA